MPSLDIFNGDAFGVQSLSAAINDQPYQAGRIGALGLFSEEGITTTSMMIEKNGATLALVSSSERGSAGTPTKAGKRQMISFPSVHLQETASVMADEVQNVRAFGSESETEVVETVVNKRLSKMRNQLDATLEYHRIGAIKGQVLDSDGSTVLLDLFTAFGLAQQTVAMVLGTTTTKLKTKTLSAIKKIEDVLGATPVSGYRVFCGATFWEAFIEHDAVTKAYDRWMDGDFLRQDPRAAFPFAGATWERYRGKVGAVSFIPDGEAYMVPEGVVDLFVTNFSPADYVEAANTIGLPYYAKQELMRMGKGVEIEAQSNPITICTRPTAVIKLTQA